ncbi:class I SAM-dependent methyltransferase [Candidatus Pelagibacter communis]|uniref:class I SAM-dependent methyltransferase n=1 Tax=Pelagibacter ubique TaxID=198252 RepID=UPI00094D013D|nr:class I SAM-dependent methyltransferase [Candidatus Pelagibacter ubique]
MNINSSILAKLFKTNITEVNKYCKTKIKKQLKFNYLNEKENNDLIIKVLSKIFEDKQIIASRGRKNKWFQGWNETLNIYRKDKNVNSLFPKFYTARENRYFRLGGKFIKVKNSNFEIKMLDIYRNWYFKKYFSKVDNIYEFGAGTGHNLVELSKIYPKKKLFGSDFVLSSIKILKLISKRKRINLQSFRFDMMNPNKKIKLLNNSAIYTSGAIEQLSGKIDKFIKYVISQKPKIIVHVEPCADFYDNKNLADYLGKIFQSKRKYTSNLLFKLKKLEKKNVIKIIKTCKSPFGSLMMEGYNLIVWKINK